MLLQLVSETVRAIRTVKLSNWERNLERRITALRENELHYLKGRKYLDAVCVYLWASAPILITIAIFSTYTVLLHEKLTAAKVVYSFTCEDRIGWSLGKEFKTSWEDWDKNGKSHYFLVFGAYLVYSLKWFFCMRHVKVSRRD